MSLQVNSITSKENECEDLTIYQNLETEDKRYKIFQSKHEIIAWMNKGIRGAQFNENYDQPLQVMIKTEPRYKLKLFIG